VTPPGQPLAAARREVLEETGHRPRIVGYVPGVFRIGDSGTSNCFFLMERDGFPVDTAAMAADGETSAVRWADPDDARSLIGRSAYAPGRARDLETPAAAYAAYDALRPGFVARFAAVGAAPRPSNDDDGWIVVEGEGYRVIPYGAERRADGRDWFSDPCSICGVRSGDLQGPHCPMSPGRPHARPAVCRDCNRPVGAFHVCGCGIEECPHCGGQYMSGAGDGSEDAQDGMFGEEE